jgi:hypothetical protein
VLKRGLHAGFLLGARKSRCVNPMAENNGNRPEIRSIVPLGQGYFPDASRHCVPGYDHAVPPGQTTFSSSSLD